MSILVAKTQFKIFEYKTQQIAKKFLITKKDAHEKKQVYSQNKLNNLEKWIKTCLLVIVRLPD